MGAEAPSAKKSRASRAYLRSSYGQQIVVKNVTGAGGTVAAGQVADAKPDGYEVLIHNIAMSTAPALYPDLPYQPLVDFKTIAAM